MIENSAPPEIIVSRLSEYTAEVAADIGALVPHVRSDYNGEPIAKASLEFIISSPDRDLIVATRQSRIIGMAAVTLHVTPSGTEAWLNDFVTSPDPSVRGQGVGRLVFDEVMNWCHERDITLGFTARDPRVHPIYEALGATPDYVTTRFSAGVSE